MLLRKGVVSFDEHRTPQFNLSFIDNPEAIDQLALYLSRKVLQQSSSNFHVALGFECDDSCIPRKVGKNICSRFSVVRNDVSIGDIADSFTRDKTNVLLVKGLINDFDIASFVTPLCGHKKICNLEVAAIIDGRFVPESNNNAVSVHSLVKEEAIFLQK